MLKAVILDVGGVLIRTHSRAGREKWAAKLGIADSWELENFVFSGELGRQTQLGQKTFEAHWQWLGQHFGLNQADLADMRRDFFAGDKLNQPLVEQIKRIRKAGYKTGLLSNFADDARWVWRDKFPFIQYFDGIIISCEVGIMKPDAQIYYLALESVGVEPEEAVFVDDFAHNIEGAKRVGTHTIHFTDPVMVQQQLAEMTGVK